MPVPTTPAPITAPPSAADALSFVVVSVCDALAGSVTFMWHVFVIPLDVSAVIVTSPAFKALTFPLSIFATLSSEDVHLMVLSVASYGRTFAIILFSLPTSN